MPGKGAGTPGPNGSPNNEPGKVGTAGKRAEPTAASEEKRPTPRRRERGQYVSHGDNWMIPTVAQRQMRLEQIKQFRRDGFHGEGLYDRVCRAQHDEATARVQLAGAQERRSAAEIARWRRQAVVIWGEQPPTRRTVAAYLVKANKYFAASAQRDRDREIGLALEQLENDRQWGVENGKRSVAVSARKEINALLGLHAAVKLKVGGDEDGAPVHHDHEHRGRASMTDEQVVRELVGAFSLTADDIAAAVRKRLGTQSAPGTSGNGASGVSGVSGNGGSHGTTPDG